jgi:outer membrane protein assembly factor BamB
MPSRRRFLETAAVAGSAGLAGCSSLPFVGGGGGGTVELRDDYPGAASPDAGWPGARRDSANTACVPDAATLSEPSVEWRSPPVPIQNAVFARRLTVAGASVLTGGQSLVAYDVVSGDRLWTQEAAFPARNAVPVADDVAWTPAPDGDPGVVGVDVASGDVTSRVTLPARPQIPPVNGSGEYGTTAVVPAAPGLVGFDPETGETAWTRRVFGHVRWSPAVLPELIAATTTGELYAYSRHGTPTWRVNPDAGVRTQPVVGSRRVYATTAGSVTAFNNADGSRDWRASDVPGVTSRTLALGGKRLFGAYDRLWALSTATGERAWERPLPSSATGLAVGGDNVYVAAGTQLLAFSRDGSERWTLDLGGEVGATVAVTETRLYTFVTDDQDRPRIVALA